MKVLLIDYGSIFYRTTHSTFNQRMGYVTQRRRYNESEFEMGVGNWENYWRCKVLGDIINLISWFKPERVVVCFDHYKTPLWRKGVFKDYKGTRRIKRDSTGINFVEYFSYSNRFISELSAQLENLIYLNVPECESDDLVAVLTREVFKDDEVIILSSDGDYCQLKKENVKCFQFNKKREEPWIVEMETKVELGIKILCGDDGDDIPNIFVMDGVPYSGRTIGLGPRTAEKVLVEGIESDFCVEKVKNKYPGLSEYEIRMNLKSNFERNLRLISFEHIPPDICENIKVAYSQSRTKPYDPREFQRYLLSAGLWKGMRLEHSFHVDLRNVK